MGKEKLQVPTLQVHVNIENLAFGGQVRTNKPRLYLIAYMGSLQNIMNVVKNSEAQRRMQSQDECGNSKGSDLSFQI